MNLNNQAMAKRRQMMIEAQAESTNPNHTRHLNQFCDYVDCVAAAVKEEIRAELPRMIQEALKQPQVQVEVDERSLKMVKRKIENLLENVLGRR